MVNWLGNYNCATIFSYLVWCDLGIRILTTWKHCERMIASLLGGTRTGCNGESRRDVEHPHRSVEVKHRKTLPNWLHSAMQQAEREAEGRVPITVLHEKGLQYDQSYVIIRLSDFNKEINYAKIDDA